MINGSDDWGAILDGHPIFSLPNSVAKEALKSPMDSLPASKNNEEGGEGTTLSGRRQVMCMKDADLILACGSEVRMTSLGDSKASGGSQKTYKVLHTPNIQFEIHQICLSPNRKFLAVAGAFQVAVIVLPRSGFSKLVMARIDCKSLQIGQYYHDNLMSPVAKIDWHPWGDSGSNLLVMTADGKLREYDVSFDPDEPRKTTNFVPEKRRGAYAAVDDSEREVASFTFGKGKADWGPLTVYALMKSGDVYAICPYLPDNASIPSSYIYGLECFVAAKQEFVSENAEVDDSFTTLYDYQRKYVNGLIKQLPAGSSFPSSSRTISIHPPKSFTTKPMRQGPFLLQPSPHELKGSPGGDATDIVYVTLGSTVTDDDDETEACTLASERIGVLMVVYQDGRVDVYLDLEKVEAKWEPNHKRFGELPMLAVYEVVDLGLIKALSHDPKGLKNTTTNLLEANHPTFHSDPIYDDTVYVYHAFGVHVLNLSPIFQAMTEALKEEDEKVLEVTLKKSGSTSVHAILSTYSVERGSSNPVTAVTIPSDVYLTYSIFILTSTLRVVSFALNLRTEILSASRSDEKPRELSSLPPLPSSTGPPAYVSILKAQEFNIPPVLTRPSGLPVIAKLSLPTSHSIKDELRVTPDSLRYIGAVVERISGEIHDVQWAYRTMQIRMELQKQEHDRLQFKAKEIVDRVGKLTGPRTEELQKRLKEVQESQRILLGRLDRVLQALINKASPELNEHETRWFEELQRMKTQVLGAGRYDSNSCKYRIQQMKNEYTRLLPTLKEISQESERKRQLSENIGGVGFSYTKSYEKLSNEERTKLEDAMKQVVKLARKLEISGLSSPPTP